VHNIDWKPAKSAMFNSLHSVSFEYTIYILYHHHRHHFFNFVCLQKITTTSNRILQFSWSRKINRN